jgi:thymidylate synthase (methanogen type)
LVFGSLAIAWQAALVHVVEFGEWVAHEEPDEKPFKEYLGPMVICVEKPFEGGRYHRYMGNRVLPKDLMDYVDEVVKGTKDVLIRLDDPNAWHYTYHQRLTAYPFIYYNEPGYGHPEYYDEGEVDQLLQIAAKLRERPTSRRAQAVTWIPNSDPYEKYPPCLQRIWCSVREDKLRMHTHWRSRDAFLASYMNMLALTSLQKSLADKIGVEVGAYYDISDSYHIYERDQEQVAQLYQLIHSPKTTSGGAKLFMDQAEFDSQLEALDGGQT